MERMYNLVLTISGGPLSGEMLPSDSEFWDRHSSAIFSRYKGQEYIRVRTWGQSGQDAAERMIDSMRDDLPGLKLLEVEQMGPAFAVEVG